MESESDRIISPEEFAERMKALNRGHKEDDHCDADDLMCETLRRLGYGDGVDYFNAIPKWYA